MSRLLMAASLRLSYGTQVGSKRLKSFVCIKRQLATKPSAPKSKPSGGGKPKVGHFQSGGTHAIMDDLPLPAGDFMKAWKKKNSKYNMVLLTGLMAFIGSVAMTASSGGMIMNFFVPDYPYTDNEMEEFAQEEERRRQEQEEREKRHQSLVEAKELMVRRRKAKDAMQRELELMQMDLDGGISNAEMQELMKLTQEREEFEQWEKQELQRMGGGDNPKNAKKK